MKICVFLFHCIESNEEGNLLAKTVVTRLRWSPSTIIIAISVSSVASIISISAVMIGIITIRIWTSIAITVATTSTIDSFSAQWTTVSSTSITVFESHIIRPFFINNSNRDVFIPNDFLKEEREIISCDNWHCSITPCFARANTLFGKLILLENELEIHSNRERDLERLYLRRRP